MKKKILRVLLIIIISNYSFSQEWNFTKPFKLNENVNSNAEESLPIFSKDSTILYFVRTNEPLNTAGENDQDIWFCKKDKNGDYNSAQKLDELNNEYNNALFGISQNNKSAYLLSSYEGKKDKVKGCAISTFSNNNWSNPSKINIPGLDIDGDFYTFTINKNEDVIILSYEGQNTIGKEDLYFSLKDKDGNWTEIKSLGSSINTTGFEISPNLSESGDTLFFSSNGHQGYGDADIFYSIKTSNNWDSWSKPINLGSIINSDKFDAYFIYSSNQVFWSSNRGEELNADIYSAHIEKKIPLKGDIAGIDVSVFGGSDGKVNINIEGGKLPYTYQWNNGEIIEDIANLKAGKYSVIVKDAWDQELVLNTTINEPGPIVENLDEIIFFDLDKSILTVESVSKLDDFVAKLKGKENFKIEITSHCDQRASIKYNINLSKRRLNSVIKYLTSKGIQKTSIIGSYKGKSDLKYECESCTEQQYLENRRTTLKVIL